MSEIIKATNVVADTDIGKKALQAASRMLDSYLDEKGQK